MYRVNKQRYAISHEFLASPRYGQSTCEFSRVQRFHFKIVFSINLCTILLCVCSSRQKCLFKIKTHTHKRPSCNFPFDHRPLPPHRQYQCVKAAFSNIALRLMHNNMNSFRKPTHTVFFSDVVIVGHDI